MQSANSSYIVMRPAGSRARAWRRYPLRGLLMMSAGNAMDLTEKLRLWGHTYAAARAAERAAAQQSSSTGSNLQREAQRLREHANRLHGEIYTEFDRHQHPRA
jgi:hypothetical protein